MPNPDAVQPFIQAVYERVGREGSQAPPGLSLSTGAALAESLGYPAEFLGWLPPFVLDAFVGVGALAPRVGPQPGAVALDLGCGAGVDGFFLARAGCRVCAADPSPTMLDRLRRAVAETGLTNLHALRAAAPRLPFHAGRFDHVLLNGVANLIPERQHLLSEIHRILRQGGHLLVADLLALEDLGEDLRGCPEAWAWCVGGAVTRVRWERDLAQAGFSRPEFECLEEIPPVARCVIRATRA